MVTIGSVVSVWNVASLFPEYFMLRNVYLTYPALQVTKEAMKQRAEQRRKEQEEGEEEGKQEEEEKDVGHAKAIEMGELALAEESEGGKDKPEGSKEGEGEGEGDEEEEKLPSASKACTSTNPLVVLYQGWSQYMTHAIFLPSLSYAFLYLTVLDSSSLTIAYLKWYVCMYVCISINACINVRINVRISVCISV